VLLLAACQGVGGEARVVDAPGVPVALGDIEGAPEALNGTVNSEVMTQASARRIDLVSTANAPRYTLKGYLTAYPTGDGDTALAFVWDVFDSAKKRAQRVSTTTVARGEAEDPWSKIGETQIAKATSQSMNQVAAFLAGESAPAPADSGSGRGGATSLGFTATP
jgi:hypothetical protein